MTKVSIIGDNFMLSEVFERKLLGVVNNSQVTVTGHTFNWPGEPLVHGHTAAAVDGLKEYFGKPDEVVSLIGDADVLITHLAPVSREMLSQLPNLKMIAVSRGGPVNINLAACKEKNVLVVNTPARNASAVAEFTVGAMLTETRMIRAGHEALRQAVWRDEFYRADSTGRELCEMTVGIVGYGAIGRLLVRLLKVFGCRIIVYDPYTELSTEDAEAGVEKADFKTILQQSDILTLHPKVTPETTKMIDAQALASMKPGALLINTTRGSLCDDNALVEALTNGKLGGAVMDTFTTEPVAEDNPYLALPNVTLTPHIAGASVRTVAFAAEQVAEEVRRFLQGEPPRNPQ